MWFITPRINTDDLTNEAQQPVQMPAPGSVELARFINGYIETPAPPIYQHVRALTGPDVPWDYGWRAALIDWPESKRIFPYPMQAPMVSYGTGGYVAQVAKAANPDPTRAVTGIRQALRAPSINEGYATN